MKEVKRGLEIVNRREVGNPLDIRELEQEYSVKIPPKYRSFAEQYLLSIDLEGVGKGLELHYLPEANPVGDVIFFDDLFTLDFCLSSYVENETWHEKGLMQIGDGPADGGILLAMAGEKLDSIIYNNGHNYTKLAGDIFSFFQDVVIVEAEVS